MFFWEIGVVLFFWGGVGGTLTLGDDPLQADDVVVAELAHDGGLAQEVHPLLLRVTHFQGLDGHRHLLLAALQGAPVDLSEFSYSQKGGDNVEAAPSLVQFWDSSG